VCGQGDDLLESDEMRWIVWERPLVLIRTWILKLLFAFCFYFYNCLCLYKVKLWCWTVEGRPVQHSIVIVSNMCYDSSISYVHYSLYIGSSYHIIWRINIEEAQESRQQGLL
jgi:hypothetical protein